MLIKLGIIGAILILGGMMFSTEITTLFPSTSALLSDSLKNDINSLNDKITNSAENRLDTSIDRTIQSVSDSVYEGITDNFKELGKSNFNVSIARCFNFVGKYILDSNQAIGDMIRDAINKPAIKLNTSINVYRGYMNSDDLINWLIVILKNSNKNCPVFNVGSDREINLKLLGQKISRIFNKKLKSKNIKSAKIDYYVPSITKAKKLLKLKISINLNDSLNSFIKLQ